MAQIYIVSATDLSSGIHTTFMKADSLAEAKKIARTSLRTREIKFVEIFDIDEDLSSIIPEKD